MKKLHCVKKSSNSKIGPCSATYRPVGLTCPSECVLLDNGCYAQRGHTNIQSTQSTYYSDELTTLADSDFVRHHVSGDFFDHDELNLDYLFQVLKFHYDNPQVVGWTYTHRWEDIEEVAPVEIHPKNLTILASVDSIKEKSLANAFGWRTARVSEINDRLDDEILCPIDLAKHLKKKTYTTCVTCRLCWTSKKNILFLKF